MTARTIRDLSVAQLKKAAAIKTRIEQLETELTGLLGIPEALTIGGTMRRHRRMSAAARAKISSAAKARWARFRAKKKTSGA
jgi:DNA polymerase/3'-5' exonuclease PolX